MKKTIPFLVAATGLILFAGIPACESSKSTSAQTLKFNYQKGRDHDYEMVFDLTQNMMGKENILNMTYLYSM